MKTVNRGRIASVTLAGVEMVQYPRNYDYIAVQNLSEGAMYVSATDSTCTAGGDDVMCITAGASAVLRWDSSTIYLRGAGLAQMAAQYDSVNPFKRAAGGGDTKLIKNLQQIIVMCMDPGNKQYDVETDLIDPDGNPIVISNAIKYDGDLDGLNLILGEANGAKSVTDLVSGWQLSLDDSYLNYDSQYADDVWRYGNIYYRAVNLVTGETKSGTMSGQSNGPAVCLDNYTGVIEVGATYNDRYTAFGFRRTQHSYWGGGSYESRHGVELNLSGGFKSGHYAVAYC